jgi:protein SCO1/2
MSQTTPSAPRSAAPFILIGALILGIVLMGGLLLTRLQQAAVIPPTPTFAPSIPGITPIEPGREVVDFTLPTIDGDLSLSDLRGGYTLMFFGYTHCPDFCPLTLAEFKRVKGLLGDDAERVNFLYISVDPARDTPQVVGEYVRRFDAEFLGMSGDEAVLTQITPDYGLYYELRTDEGRGDNYLVDHSTASYLIDPQRRLRAVFSYDASPEAITDYITSVMAADAGATA